MFPDKQLSRFYLLLLTFWIGVVTLAVEVFAFRSMALILSSSIIVTSVVIALVIISLSFGYYLSIGVKPQEVVKRISQGLIIISCCLPFMALIAPVATRFLGAFVYAPDHMASMAIVSVVSLLLLTLPLPLFIGYISPLLFSCLRKHYANDQETAARSFIASGVGSLIGSVVPNLLLIPFIGMTHSYLLLAIISALMATRIMSKKGPVLLLSVILTVSVIASWLSGLLRFRPNLEVSETPYQTIFVWQNSDDGVITMSFNAQIGSQSYLDRELAYRHRSYFDNVLLFLLKDYPQKKNVLMLGSAGATISTLANTYLGDKIELSFTNVDIDPQVHRLARRWFAAEYDNVRFVADDARNFVRSDSAEYDLIVLDVYVNELFIPATLYSTEFFQVLRERLKPDGVITMNVNAKSEDSPIIQAGLGTLARVFEHVYVTTDINEGVAFAPILLTASPQEVDFRAMARANPVAILQREISKMPSRTKKIDGTRLPYIEDDTAMTEYLSILTLISF